MSQITLLSGFENSKQTCTYSTKVEIQNAVKKINVNPV
jgi:hypothetical protein